MSIYGVTLFFPSRYSLKHEFNIVMYLSLCNMFVFHVVISFFTIEFYEITDVPESRCRVLLKTNEFWLHILNVGCDDSISATAVQNSLPGSTHPNDESQSVCASVSSSYVGGLRDENFQAKEDFQMKSTSPEHQCEIDSSPGAIERNADSPVLSTQSSLFCDVCQVPFTSIKNKEEHENGKMHKKQIVLKSKWSGHLSMSQSLSITGDIQEGSSKNHIHWSPGTQSFMNTNSTADETVDSQPQPTMRNTDEGEITVVYVDCA
ncbi:unnamed protein product [Trichobilharzia szidati]|nr:unnamed protein product [Trichobilharzia szidati]CAH8829176.1 unnamed protein product [Trichobilharzia szidati]